MRLSGKSEQAGLALLYLGLGLAGVFVWSRIADLPRLPSWHMEMIYGTVPAPNQCRPLSPWIAELLCRVLPGHNLHTSYLLLRGLTTGVTLLLFGVMWVLPFLGPRTGPIILRRVLWLLLPYIALHYVVARVVEVRLFLPFAPVVIPLSWWRLFSRERARTKESTASAGPITQ